MSALRGTPLPLGFLAYTLLRSEAALRNMCFIDNEFGGVEQDRIDAIALRCVNITNAGLASRHRHIRVFSIKPLSKRHHHVVIEWGITPHVDDEGNDVPMQMLEPLIANLYEPSKRVQEEEEERVGPRRGNKLQRPKKSDAVLSAKKKRREYDNDRDLDARDSGGDLDLSPMMGSVADAYAPTQNDSKTDMFQREAVAV